MEARFRGIALGVLLWLCGWSLEAQRIQLVNTASLFSEAAIANNNAKLDQIASLKGWDVRFSFVSNFTAVADRWNEYNGEELIQFLSVPGSESSATTEAEMEASNIKAAHYAANTPSPMGQQTVHFVHSGSVYLDAENVQQLTAHSPTFWGRGFSRLDKLKIRQAAPEESDVFSYFASPSENDAWLTAYVDRLLETTEENYVVTGTIKYNEGIYLDGDTIVLDYQRPSGYYGQGANPAPTSLSLQMQNGANSSVSWTEPPPIDNYDSPMLGANSGSTVPLNVIPYHFANFKNLTATFGNGNTTRVTVLPVNLKIDTDPVHLESVEDEEVSFTINNNILPFANRGNFKLRVRFSGGDDQDLVVLPSVEPVVAWVPSAPCSQRFYQVELLDKNSDVILSTPQKEYRIKCPYQLAGIRISGTNNADTESGLIVSDTRVVEDGETLYMVGDPDIQRRVVQIESLWDGERPQYDEDPLVNDYWTSGTYSEPRFRLKSSDLGNPARPSSRKAGEGKFNTTYYDAFFPQSVLDPGNTTINYEDVSVEAFGQTATARLAFLRENKSTTTLQTPYDGAFEFFTKKLKFINDKIEQLGKRKLKLDIQTSYKESYYNREAKEYTYYFKHRKEARDLKIEFGTDEIVFPPPLGVSVPAVGRIGVFVKGRLFLSPEYGREYRWPYNEPEVNEEYLRFSVKVPGGGKVEFGILGELLPNVSAITLKLKGYAELKPYVAATYIADEEESYYRVEATFNPITLNASGEGKFKLTDDINIKVFSFKKSYEITKKYTVYKDLGRSTD